VSSPFFRRSIVPVASEDDAAETAVALTPYVDADSTVIAVHVVEKAGGALDKASVEQRELAAEAVFDAFTDRLGDAAGAVETQIHYGTDVARTIVDAAHDSDATAIVFTPREGGRWAQLLSGDVSQKLLDTSDIPVLVLPEREVDDA